MTAAAETTADASDALAGSPGPSHSPCARRALAVLGALGLSLIGPADAPPVLQAPAAAAVELPTALPLSPSDGRSADAQRLLAAEHGTWRWPVSPDPRVVRDFDPPAERWLSGHRGVDLTTGLSGEVRAPEDGRISHVGTVVDRATITIDHGEGLRSSFEPVSSDLRKGDRVRKGQVIGVLSEQSHCLVTVRACVHWGVRLNDDYVHPLPFVGAHRPSVLLPVPE